MKRLILGITLLALFVPTTGVAQAAAGHVRPMTCVPGRHVLLADAQAQVYSVLDSSGEYFTIRACAYKERRSFVVASCNLHEAVAACAKSASVTLAGPMVAYEYAISGGTRDVEGPLIAEWYVEVRDLLAGRILHMVPTGVPLQPRKGYVGVGPVTGLVLKSDGAVAWIADDYERSRPEESSPEVPYFDLYAVDKAGTRLLAAGTNIDPSSLALAVGGVNVPYPGRSVTGGALYWTSGGTSFSASLN